MKIKCLFLVCLLLAGCSEFELTKPQVDNSPPGYKYFKWAQEGVAARKPYEWIQRDFCKAAGLGYKEAVLYCSIYSIELGGNAICVGAQYDPDLVDLCKHKDDKYYIWAIGGHFASIKKRELEVKAETEEKRQTIQNEIYQNKYEIKEEDF